MASDTPSSDFKKADDEAFAVFHENWISGNPQDPDELCKAHPQCSPELRQRIVNFINVAKKISSMGPPGFAPSPPNLDLDDYKIIKKIGSGGMGAVYEAEQISINRKVALKILSPHLGFSDRAVQRFQREAEAAGRQNHPGIVSVFAIGNKDELHYIVQELIQGSRTLEDKLEEIKKTQTLPSGYFRKIAKLISLVADALHHAHESNVIHRDIKPSNILLTKDGTPKVSDFGLAKIEDVMTLSRTGDIAGTPYYMSPEQAAGDKKGVDRRTDIYSLGVSLYELLTLKHPYTGDSSHEVLKKIASMEPLDPNKANPRTPQDLSTICLKAMEKQPAKRYQTMAEFSVDLNCYLQGDVIHARPAGMWEKLWKRMRKKPALSLAVLVIISFFIYILITYPIIMGDLKRAQENLILNDMDRLFRLKSEGVELWPRDEDLVLKTRAWLYSADDLTNRLDQHLETSHELKNQSSFNKEEQNYLQRIDELITGIEEISHPEQGLIKAVRKRLEFAESVREETIEKQKENWARAITAISDPKKHPKYNGLKIKPQLGLIPIGPDPDSGLWEFSHLQTGEVAKRQNGKLVITEETGLVFVLIPGGRFIMGAKPTSKDSPINSPNTDPHVLLDEMPTHEVTIKPFFMSKYEMCFAQWSRCNFKYDIGANYGLLPIYCITWEDCSKVASNYKIRFPSESEWEYAARAGTATVWHTGNKKESLIGAANILDVSNEKYVKERGVESNQYESWINDGYVNASPIGSFIANDFGLYDMHGNIQEWCQDTYSKRYDHAPRDGAAYLDKRHTGKVLRGGSYRTPSISCRSANRSWFTQARYSDDVGFRPARSLD